MQVTPAQLMTIFQKHANHTLDTTDEEGEVIASESRATMDTIDFFAAVAELRLLTD